MTPTIESFVQALKEQLAAPKDDLDKNIRALLNEMISKMDLVSHDELQRHKTALEQANSRLNELQEQVKILESRMNHP